MKTKNIMNSTKTDSSPRTEKCRDSSTLPEAPFPPRDGDFTITPEWAARVLAECNTRNRKVSPTHVWRLAEDIRRGQWVFNKVPILFDLDGTLIDGQHRLFACIKAREKIPMSVRTDVLNENLAATNTVDTGKKRMTDDCLKLAGFQNTTFISGSIKVYFSFKADVGLHENLAANTSHRSSYTSNQEIMFFYNQNKICIDAAISFFRRNALRSIGLPTSFCAGFTVWLEKEKEMPFEISKCFFDEIRPGCTHSSVPAALLREQIQKWKNSAKDKTKNKTAGAKKTSIFIRAFRAWIFAKPIKTIASGKILSGKSIPRFSELPFEARFRLQRQAQIFRQQQTNDLR